MKEPIIKINPNFMGSITLKDLLESRGTVLFTIKSDAIISSDLFYFFIIDHEEFVFAAYIQDNLLYIHRSGVELVVDISKSLQKIDKMTIFIDWNPLKIGFSCGSSEIGIKHFEKTTHPVSPPASLLVWARKQSLLPLQSYETYEQFREKVHLVLLQLNDKVAEANAYKSFWNITYSGNTITERSPKKEVDIHPLIQCFLSDQMLLSGIEISANHSTGAGLVDFLMSGYVDGIGISKICIEVKTAHSEDLERGLVLQLPQYMRSTKSKYGAYLVLDFRCDWFDQPILDDNKDLPLYLTKVTCRSEDPLLRNFIRFFCLNLGKPATASKL